MIIYEFLSVLRKRLWNTDIYNRQGSRRSSRRGLKSVSDGKSGLEAALATDADGIVVEPVGEVGLDETPVGLAVEDLGEALLA